MNAFLFDLVFFCFVFEEVLMEVNDGRKNKREYSE